MAQQNVLAALVQEKRTNGQLKDVLVADERAAKSEAALQAAQAMFKHVTPDMTVSEFASLWLGTVGVAYHKNLAREFVAWARMLHIPAITVGELEAKIAEANKATAKKGRKPTTK